jgi:hypothetical protein
MEKQRKTAQLGLALIGLVLFGCLALLFFQDRAAAKDQDTSSGESTAVSKV